ncbi:hypothetical protein BDV38DRAFT_246801 [Aspergillus pseudotamarii]|uniref:Fe2OG dioxygenase domain-containing protein n=1 Tax=Aspergillus pseudotamarii TaxID=132259 RepID=A0A5N6SRY8_ASPPS|nr:uncharacterized protein BDV38DRAFT_246801 [Aspergillus pseudotamarii]KAE8137456.1 hypothetical protein BDV38DRAFT_246801 [Aspergillus pseudotamarii]
MTFIKAKRIPCFDFSKFTAGAATGREAFSYSVLKAFQEYGFIQLTNHGIEGQFVDRLFKWNRELFALPAEAKLKAAHPPQPNPHRGYSAVGQEKLSMVSGFEKGIRTNKTIFDLKESFDQGSADDDRYPNIWPDETDLPGFRKFMETTYERMHLVHMELLHVLETALHLEAGFFQDKCRENTSELRLNHYPACETAQICEQGAMRISEHSDFGTLTLLFQDAVGGLEVEDQASYGQFIPIEPTTADVLIVNVGDCLQRWTNALVRSANHRVRLPPHATEAILADRYSVAYFGKPSRAESVGPLEQFISNESPAKYEHLSAWEYNQSKLLRTY